MAKNLDGGLIKMAPSTSPVIFVSEADKGLTKGKAFSFPALRAVFILFFAFGEGAGQPILAEGHTKSATSGLAPLNPQSQELP
jgi:hypothetical protein